MSEPQFYFNDMSKPNPFYFASQLMNSSYSVLDGGSKNLNYQNSSVEAERLDH